MFKWLIKKWLNFIAKKLIDFFVNRLWKSEVRLWVLQPLIVPRSLFLVLRFSFFVSRSTKY